MSRLELVHAYLEKTARMKWGFGAMDCAHFAAGMVEVLTGQEVISTYERYNEDSHEEYLKTRGGIVAIATKQLGEPLHEFKECQIGDIVMADLTDGETLWIALPHIQGGAAIFKQGGYVVNVPFSTCLMFWSVPCLR